MKQKFIKWSAPLLSSCLALGWVIGFDFASLLLFGEYQYPQDSEN